VADLAVVTLLWFLSQVEALRTCVDAHLAAGHGGELVRSGVRVALLGPPNAGKSSLLNALAGREVAIVSARPGTTRDLLEVSLDLGGYKAVVSDSAGARTRVRRACSVVR
jgi:tRNA modification GTPase